MAALFAAGLVVFILVRQAVIPPGFGKYGHFRPGVLDEVRARPVVFAGREACAMCHEGEAKILHSGKHANVGCESCHWAQAQHAADPEKVKPALPDTRALCAVCHEANSAKPKSFPQVVSKDHSGGEPCKTCHQPHRPNPDTKEAK
jgi:hypothetical protein